MRIGIDLDWTLANHGRFWGLYLGLDRDFKRHEIHHFFGGAIFGKIKLSPADLWKSDIKPVLTDPMWPRAIRILRGRGCEVDIVTNQESEIREEVSEWLVENGILVDRVRFLGPEEVKGGYDILVDDSIEKLADVMDDTLGLLWCSDFGEEEMGVIKLSWPAAVTRRIIPVTSAMEVVMHAIY